MNTIELQNVSVRYRTHKIRSLKEASVQKLKMRPASPHFYSLRNVSLTVKDGESVGVIGSNGAGKSTLLRVAAGIITPTEGVTITRGTIAPLMELGTGFEPELSGRENIMFNGALLGRSRAQMREHMDQIIAFSGLEEFIDSPLRTYSTGMVARLAFAVATAIDAETILLDEILAVGDAAFRSRCHERIEKFVAQGMTILLVSHELEVVARLCQRVICLSHGEIVADGPAAKVIAEYESARAAQG